MKILKYLFISSVLALSFTACDDDHEPDWAVQTPYDVHATELSIADGATNVSAATTEIEVTYDTKIIYNSAVKATLNGADVELEIKDDSTLVAKVALQKGKNYSFVVPARAITGIGAMTFAPEVVINFSTEAVPGIDKTKIATAPINSNATAEAKKLYSFLLENYGQKQLSGAMGGVAWETGFSDMISASAGKYPAIIGFDYIHLASSPANWIDYGDITPVQTIWNAGSIPAVTWHWNVPTSRPGTTVLWTGEQDMPADWSQSVQINDEAAKEALAGVTINSIITVKTKNVNAGAQGSVKNGSTWSGLTSELEYFDINGDYSVTVTTNEMVNDIKTNGIIISGHDYTATEISITFASGDLGYDASSQAFSAANVCVEGTWENSIAKQDVAKLAGYMKLLQDAGIPVLFRPFHEAAGDYTWGTWFWWGNSGVETTKDLWKWLYNTLTNDYGLNNLIWVWTMQTSDEGKLATPAQLQAAYPGDEYVDIVGADLYEEALSDQSDKFNLIQEAVNGKKIIALTETGNLLNPESQEQSGTLWSFFMGWYEQDDNGPGFLNWNKNNEWNTVLNNPLVLNQGDYSIK